jgi:hypothetical protein
VQKTFFFQTGSRYKQLLVTCSLLLVAMTVSITSILMAVSPADVSALDGNSHILNGLQSANIAATNTLTQVFIGNSHSEIHPRLQKPEIKVSFAQTQLFLGNSQSNLHSGLVRAPVEPQPLSDLFLGGGVLKKQPLIPPLLIPDVIRIELVSPEPVPSGTEFNVLIRIDAAQDLAGGEVKLSYDPALLTFKQAQPGEDFIGCESQFNDALGKLKLALACGSGHSDIELVLWIVAFFAAEVTQPTETHLRTTQVKLVDTRTPTPRVIPSIGASRTLMLVDGICGDQNDDGVLNILDVIIDLRITVGTIEPTATQMILSDLSRDGGIGVEDAVMGLHHIVGMRPAFDSCGPHIP